MNKVLHDEEKAMRSYVTGFLLSLVFTFIPYYLVEKHTLSSTVLLDTILAFAFVQMIVQVTFFLHLGRGPKPRWNLFFFMATGVIILGVVGGSILIIDNLHYNMSPLDQTKKLIGDEAITQVDGTKTGACPAILASHIITIKDGKVSPSHTDAKKCDKLTFINQDSGMREIAFGAHPAHEAYAGNIDLSIGNGRNKTITLSEIGTYSFHDHLQEETAGDFTVSS